MANGEILIPTMTGIDDAPSDGYEYVRKNGAWSVASSGGGISAWGDIEGDIADQIDLQDALDAKTNVADLGTMSVVDDAPSNGSEYIRKNGAWSVVSMPIASNAGAHNAIYRGNSLGSSVTADQWSAISAGTFDDLFIGDYWTINSVNWRIAAFDYWYGRGDGDDNKCTTHHITIVPDTCLATCKMNNSETASGSYVGSNYYTGANSNTGKTTAQTKIEGAFGASHILSHREYMKNTVSNGIEVASAWYNSTFELMTERMVYGCRIFSNMLDIVNGQVPAEYEYFGQLPLFAFNFQLIMSDKHYWLRNIVNGNRFCSVHFQGLSDISNPTNDYGVRPAFGIKA